MMTSAGVEPGRQRHPSQGEAGVAGHGAIPDVGVDVEISAGRRRIVDVEDLAHHQRPLSGLVLTATDEIEG